MRARNEVFYTTTFAKRTSTQEKQLRGGVALVTTTKLSLYARHTVKLRKQIDENKI